MPNTCNLQQSAEVRLAELAGLDPTAAEQITAQLAACAPDLPTDIVPADAAVKGWILANNIQTTPDIVVMPGVGDGGALKALLQEFSADTHLLLLEHDIRKAATVFVNLPLEEWVRDGRITLALGDDAVHVEKQLVKMLDMQKPPSFQVYALQSDSDVASEFYFSILKKIRQGVHLNIFNLNTLIDHGPLWQFNSLKNLPHLISNPGITRLFDRFAGRPAIVVGAGPSLNETLPYLREVAGRFVILSTATALRALNGAGIRPDLVVAVDASRKTAGQFMAPCEDLFLACSSIAYPPAIPKFKGIFSGQLDANPIDRWLNARCPPKGCWVAAGTVTTTAVDLAIRMGCNPVVSVGFDLSFKGDGTTHANNTMYHGSRLDPQHLIKVPGNFEKDVLTTEQFKVYITLLENYIEARPDTRFVNMTKGGALIRGMEVRPPEELSLWGGEMFDAFDMIKTAHHEFVPENLDGVRDDLQLAVNQFEDVMLDAHQAAMLCNRLIMTLRSPCSDDEPEVRGMLDDLKKIDARFAEMHESSLLLDMSLWPIAYRSGTVASKDEERFSAAVLANHRSRELYEQIAGAAKWTRLLLMDVIDEIGRRLQSAEKMGAWSNEWNTLNERPVRELQAVS